MFAGKWIADRKRYRILNDPHKGLRKLGAVMPSMTKVHTGNVHWRHSTLGGYMTGDNLDDRMKNKMGREILRDINSWCTDGDALTMKQAIVKAVVHYRDNKRDCPLIWYNNKTLLDRNVHSYEHNRGTGSGEWGTDGSVNTVGQAGYGLCSDLDGSRDMAHQVPGKQTINRAEAMAVLHGLLTSSLDVDLRFYVDSKITINGIEKVARDKSARLYKDLSNFSIFKTIGEIIQERESRGKATVFEKVKSHEVDTPALYENATHPQKMNKMADGLADAGVGRLLLDTTNTS